MTAKEILLEDFDTEMANTRRILERIPEDKPEYKPHAKSFAIGKLSMHVATLPIFAKYIMTMSGMDLANSDLPRPDLVFRTRDTLLATFEQSLNEAKTALATVSEAALAERWKFCFGEHVISNDTRSKTYRNMFLNHLIHHRAQLGVYLRLNDIPVPGLYGPSADEPFNP